MAAIAFTLLVSVTAVAVLFFFPMCQQRFVRFQRVFQSVFGKSSESIPLCCYADKRQALITASKGNGRVPNALEL